MTTLQAKAKVVELEAEAIRNEVKIDSMRATLRKACEHLGELAEAWERGIITEHDGKGGTRSNRNHAVLLLIRQAMKEQNL